MIRMIAWCVGIPVLLVGAFTAWLTIEGRPSRPSPAQYVALGSSFASGPSVTTRASDSPIFCVRSSDNYAHQLARRRRLTLVDATCSGATIQHVLVGGQWLQPAQLDALTPETELVTLTIGGNDIAYVGNMMAYGCQQRSHGFWRVVQALSGCRVVPAVEVDARLKSLPSLYDRIAAEIHRRSSRARLVMLTYQTVLPPSGSCSRLGMTVAQADRSRAVAAALADVVVAAADRNGAELYDAAAATAGHDVCSDDPWMNDQQASAPLHPTFASMAAVAEGLDKSLGAPALSGDPAE